MTFKFLQYFQYLTLPSMDTIYSARFRLVDLNCTNGFLDADVE